MGDYAVLPSLISFMFLSSNRIKQLTALAAVSFAFYAITNQSLASGKPNIILIMADDLGYECIGANGGTSYKTPILDGLAKSGMRFTHCYAQPVCTPSRVKIMTGMSNIRNYTAFGVLDREQTTFAHLLKKADYATCIVGKWQLGSEEEAAQHFGFDESCLWQHTRDRTAGRGKDGNDSRYPNPRLEVNGKPVDYNQGEYGPDVVSDFLCHFIEEQKDHSFFVYYPMMLTHCPFVPTPDSKDWDPKSMGSQEYKGEPKYFGDMVTYMDKIVGKITDKLDVLGLRKNTLVLFTGDNGTDLPVVSMMDGREVAGAKREMTDAGTRVPLIASWPGVIPEGQVCEDLVDFSDFLPTFCEMAGVAIPSELKIDGKSFLPQLKGDKGNPREWIYCWYSPKGGPVGREWARNQRYKLYHTGKFFDIENDVLEKSPLKSLSPEIKEIRAMLQGALDQYKDARPLKYAGGSKKKNKKKKSKKSE